MTQLDCVSHEKEERNRNYVGRLIVLRHFTVQSLNRVLVNVEISPEVCIASYAGIEILFVQPSWIVISPVHINTTVQFSAGERA